jgi:hypothetical protein
MSDVEVESRELGWVVKSCSGGWLVVFVFVIYGMRCLFVVLFALCEVTRYYAIVLCFGLVASLSFGLVASVMTGPKNIRSPNRKPSSSNNLVRGY